jgi:hypothetical protein
MCTRARPCGRVVRCCFGGQGVTPHEVCLQENKPEHLVISFIRSFAPSRFDRFDFIPSQEASGGLLLIWNSSVFKGSIIQQKQFCITTTFVSTHNGKSLTISNVYDPCEELGRLEFIHRFKNCEVDDNSNWIFMGDFNFYHSLENRNKPGGNLTDILIFNEVIGDLGLIELLLKGRAFT